MLNKTVDISFSVKEDILLSLKENPEEFTQNCRFLSALMLYKKTAYLGKAAELAGYSKIDFIEKLKLENESVFDYSAQEMTDIFNDVAKLP